MDQANQEMQRTAFQKKAVSKLAPEERSALLEAAARAARGRAALSVTVFGQTPEAQIAFVREAERAGAANVVLQPPRIPGIGEHELARFFGRVIDAAGVPAGIQNAPEYIGIGLGVEAIVALARNHPNFRVLKMEGSAMLVRRRSPAPFVYSRWMVPTSLMRS